jgi:polyketide synthase PksN
MCSSSLSAIHLASEAIRRGEIDAAIAGGVNLSLHPQKYLSLSQGNFASSDGRCRSFGAGGDGYVPGEGVGAVFLKPLDQALRDRDHVYAIVKSSSINHGGKTNGYSVPNPNAQGDLILEALAKAKIDPGTVSYIETHGTGTSLGDPIEFTGLSKAFAAGPYEPQRCSLGSVKSNIGHLESAAGIAALTKVLLQLEHGELVPSLHAEPSNPNINFADSPFYVQTRLTQWKRAAQHPRRAAISSFGAGGSNAHVILEEAPVESVVATSGAESPEVFVLSARDAQALARYAQRLVQSLETLGNSTAADIAYTLQCGRTPMTVRLAILSSSLNDFRVKLLQWLQDFETSPAGGNVPDGIYYGNTRDSQLGAGGLLAGETGQSFVSELLARAELAKLASMWTLGVEIDWGKLSRRQMPRRVSLPTYPFTRQRYWIDTQKALLPATAPPVEHLVTPPVKHAVSSDPQTAQVTTMPGLQLASRVTEAGLQSLRSMCLRPDWRASSLEAAGESFEGSILVVDTSDELFVALGEQVAASSRITLACSGNRYQQTGLNRFNIERAKEADYSRLFADLRTQKRFPSVIVLHASEPWSDEDFATLTRAPAGLEAAFRLCKALARQRRAAFPHLLTVFSSDPDRGAPHNSALAGFFKSLALEKPGTRSKIIDIRAAADMLDVGRIASRVWDEMRDRSWIRGDRSQTHEIRYEAGGARFVKEWLECKFPAADTALPLRTGGTYLITGGLGGLGLIFARHLASRYRAQLILTGRSQLSHEGESHLIELRQLGAEVVYFPADVSSYAEIEGVVREGEARFTRLNGVIHAAGIHEDGYFTRKSLDDIIKVLRPKVSGVSNLDRAVGGRDLDFFVAFSSIAGALGNLGQCDYCYANQFLDEYMAVRRSRVGSRRGASISINWPFWDQGGMALSENQRSALASTTGLHPLPTPLGLELFEQMLASRLGHGMPLYGDVTRIRAHLAILSGRGASAAVGSEAVPESVPASAHATEAAPQARAAEAGAGGAGAPPGAIQQTEDYLRDRLAEELHLSAQSIDRQERLDAYGLDSVMINKLMARLQQDLGPVPPTLFYELQTVQEIARYLANAARVARPPGEADRPEQAELLELPEQSMQSVPVAPGTLDQRTPVALSEPFEARQAEEAPERVEPLPAPDLAPNRDMRIAIVGVHGRFPKSQDLHEYWDNLRQGRDLITVVPPDRWDQGELYHPDPAMAADGKIYCKWGGFLDDHDKFDARFFNIAAQDACVIDPQERLMLESAWSAIEDAGYTRESLKRRFPKGKSADVGVFVGVTTNSYQLLLPSRLGPGNAAIPAALPWSIANRISYFFDFRGPSMPVDTACSSSLVAIHLACQSLRNGECQVAIAGGVNLYSHPSKYVSLCQRRMLSAGSRCCSYGAGDDGFVPGEAVGSLVLKPLSRAIEDGDQIYAVIAGSGVDHAGRSNGYSAPNPNSQASLINEVLLASRIHPRTLSYIEGHGTGTQLGDSLEVAALTRAFRAQTDATQFCALGSVKANIGHSESAAGIAAIAKVLLQLKHRQLAPTIHSDEINGHVDLVNSPFYLRHGLADWQEAGDVPRRALINSFGAGGVNSCLIVEEHTSPRHGATGGDGPHLFVLSAQNAERLREYVQRFADWLHSGPRIDPASLCYTLQTGREPMAERLACVIGDLAELAERLDGWLEGATENSYRGCVDPESMPAINAEVLSGLDSSTQLTTERLNDIARSWASGHSVRWEELYGSDKPLRVSLPTYPFARERHWVQNESTAQHRADAEFGAVLHPFISSNSSTLREVSFSSWLTDAGFPAQDHRINGTPILPGAAFLEIACIAGTIAGERSVRLARDVVWMKPVSFEGGARALRTFLKQIGETVEFAVTSLDDDGEREVYCEGRLFYNGNPESEAQPRCSIPTFKNRAVESLAGAEFYQAMARQGFRYGPGFQSLQELFIGTDFALSRLRIPSHLEHEHEQFMLHPSLLDGALQTAAALVRAAGGAEPHLPFALDELEVVRSIPRTCYVLAQPASADSRSVSGIRCFDIRLVTERGEPLVALRNLYVRELQALQPSHAGTISSRSK